MTACLVFFTDNWKWVDQCRDKRQSSNATGVDVPYLTIQRQKGLVSVLNVMYSLWTFTKWLMAQTAVLPKCPGTWLSGERSLETGFEPRSGPCRSGWHKENNEMSPHVKLNYIAQAFKETGEASVRVCLYKMTAYSITSLFPPVSSLVEKHNHSRSLFLFCVLSHVTIYLLFFRPPQSHRTHLCWRMQRRSPL